MVTSAVASPVPLWLKPTQIVPAMCRVAVRSLQRRLCLKHHPSGLIAFPCCIRGLRTGIALSGWRLTCSKTALNHPAKNPQNESSVISFWTSKEFIWLWNCQINFIGHTGEGEVAFGGPFLLSYLPDSVLPPALQAYAYSQSVSLSAAMKVLNWTDQIKYDPICKDHLELEAKRQKPFQKIIKINCFSLPTFTEQRQDSLISPNRHASESVAKISFWDSG